MTAVAAYDLVLAHLLLGPLRGTALYKLERLIIWSVQHRNTWTHTFIIYWHYNDFMTLSVLRRNQLRRWYPCCAWRLLQPSTDCHSDLCSRAYIRNMITGSVESRKVPSSSSFRSDCQINWQVMVHYLLLASSQISSSYTILLMMPPPNVVVSN